MHRRPRTALRTLKPVMLGAGFISGFTVQSLKGTLAEDARVQVAYGSSEAGGVSAVLPGQKYVPDHVGGIQKGVEIRIVDEATMEEVLDDDEGEVCIRSPAMFSGYVNNRKATESTFFTDAQGLTWFRSGDKGRFSTIDQQLMITGRFKENFKVGPDHVSPEEVEALLMEHAGVSDVAIASTAGRRNQGDIEPVAYVVQKGRGITGQEAADFVATRLSPYKAPTAGLVSCDQIPRTTFGKIARRELNKIQGGEGSTGFIDLARE